MTAIGVYVATIRAKQEFLGMNIGASVPGMAPELRVILTLSNVPWAALVKLLVDKGLITDAEILAAVNAAGVAVWAAENPNPLSSADADLPAQP